MSVLWELSLGGDRRPLRAWGIASANLRRRSFGVGELSLTAPALAIDEDPLFPAEQAVVLWRDGARHFTGRITSPEVYGAARTENHTYVASDPWWFLENLRYQESRYMAVDPTDPDSALQEVFSPRAVLFNTLAGAQQTAAQQITQALGYANTRGANIAVGTIGIGAQPPWEEASSISCAEVVKRSARYAPDAVQWWDHATAKPTCHVRRRGVLDAVSLDLDAADRISLLSIRPLNEARVPGVRFFFEDIVQRSNGKTWARYVSQSAGNPNLVGAINEVIELGGQGGDNPEPIPAGLAAAYYDAVSVLNYGGRIVVKGRDAATDVALGKVLNLTNGRAEWETMRATIQETTEDLVSGEVVAAFGQPAFLGAAAFVEYLRYSRLRQKSGYLDARRTGEGVTSAVPASTASSFGGSNTGFVEIDLCGDNTTTPPTPPKRIRFMAETVTP